MIKKLVSVIVPVYNSELVIENCVESLLQQTYPEIEILLIDDGSTDKS
ncbi:glycosyltransferase family 2 protein, partial [Streptococcus agalactiae]